MSTLIREILTIHSKAPKSWETFSGLNGDILYFKERASYPDENVRDRILANIKAITATFEDWKESISKLDEMEKSCNAFAKIVSFHSQSP
jgi:hypothetical protein